MSSPLVDIGSIVAIVGLAIAVLKLYLEHRKAKKDLKLAKEYLQILTRLVESYKKGTESRQQLEKQRFEWQKLETTGKALWGLFKHFEEGENSYE